MERGSQRWRSYELIRAELDKLIVSARSARTMCAADAPRAVEEGLSFAAAHLKAAQALVAGVIRTNSNIAGEQELPFV